MARIFLTVSFRRSEPARLKHFLTHMFSSISGAVNSGSLSNAGGNYAEQTTLLHNEEESFALEPVDASAIRGQVNHIFTYFCLTLYSKSPKSAFQHKARAVWFSDIYFTIKSWEQVPILNINLSLWLV